MSYQEKYLKYKSKYLNLRAEIHNNNLENRLEQNGGNLDILNVDQLSGTVSITEKKYLMLGGSKESDLDLPDKLTETPISESENNLTSEEKSISKSEEKSISKSENNLSSEEKYKTSDVNSDSEDDDKEHDDKEHDDEFSSSSSTSLSPSSSESKNQKGGKKEEKHNKKTAWFSDSELVSTDTTFMSFSTLDTSSESDL